MLHACSHRFCLSCGTHPRLISFHRSSYGRSRVANIARRPKSSCSRTKPTKLTNPPLPCTTWARRGQVEVKSRRPYCESTANDSIRTFTSMEGTLVATTPCRNSMRPANWTSSWPSNIRANGLSNKWVDVSGNFALYV
jgi:hypothetical protein